MLWTPAGGMHVEARMHQEVNRSNFSETPGAGGTGTQLRLVAISSTCSQAESRIFGSA